MGEKSTEFDEAIATAALSWIAGDGEQISRFMALTGIEPEQMRTAASQTGFLGGVLEFLLGHEPTLVRFCEDNDLSPTVVQKAYQRLVGAPVPGPGDFV